MVLFALVVHAGLVATEACQRPIDLAPALYAPVDGALDVPTNARIVINDVVVVADDVTVTSPTGEVPFDVDELPVAVGFDTDHVLRVLTPRAPLTAGATITVSTGETLLGTFTVGPAVDDTRPAEPRVTVLERYDGGACTPLLELDVLPQTDAAFSTASLGDDDVIDGIALGRALVVAGEANQTYAIVVRAVDLAGNVSDPVTVTGTMPPEIVYGLPPGCLCSSSTSAVPAPFAVLAVAVLRRVLRRRRR